MGKYKVLDIFSFLPANVISLEQLEKMFLDSLSEISNNTKLGNEEIVVTCSSQSWFTENIKECATELKSEGKQVAYIVCNEKPIDFVATLLEGKVKYQKLPSGNSDYIEFYDKNGEMVATYSNNGWTMYTTNAEASRQTEMCMIYNEAWGNAKRGIPLESEETVNVDNMQSSFDAKAQQKIIPNKPQRTGRAVPTTMKQSCLPDVLMEHGIGLKNAEAVLEKYDGRIAFDCDEKEFRVVVILQSVSATNSR